MYYYWVVYIFDLLTQCDKNHVVSRSESVTLSNIF